MAPNRFNKASPIVNNQVGERVKKNRVQRTDPPPCVIRDFISYDPDTGLFMWVKTPARKPHLLGSEPGRIIKDGYRQIKFQKRMYMAHRLAWWWVTEEWPDTLIDHENGIPDDNRFSNIRKAMPFQNSANRGAMPGRGLPKGVAFRFGRYHSRIGYDMKQYFLGSFATQAEAVDAYNRKSIELFGEFARESTAQPL